QEKYQKAARLDDALLVKGEIDLVGKATWPLPPLEKKAPADLVAARKLYFKTHLGYLKNSSSQIVKIADRMEELLTKTINDLTKEGNLEGAKGARAYQESLKKDPKIKEARTFLTRVRRDGSSPVALRLRRAGDHIEILVRYDSGGKISLQSPVENVVEITGGKGEKGETKARLLGEFIGSADHEVDSYVALDKTFSDRKFSPMTATELELGFRKKEGDEAGVQFTTIANPVNNHAKFGSCLPNLAEQGTYRVQVRYFLPKTNREMDGFVLVHSVGGALAESEATVRGAWTTLDFQATAVNEHRNLLFYPKYNPNASKPYEGGDSVIIASIKVTHTKFSAFIVERLDTDGAVSETFPEAGAQPAFARNGKFIPAK
ncbi:hypothetical protein OAF11_03470, partial [Akkermansiaceae bacterium]|nr:hypothetical protein [Akkermansiaceae bacterium]